MADSTTGESTENSGGNQPLPEGTEGKQPAEQHGDNTSGGESQGSESKTESKGSKESKQTDDGLAKFAKSQGIEDLDSMSERERKLLKIAHDNQREFHKKRQEDSELRKSITDLHDPAKAGEGIEDEAARERAQLRAEMVQLKSYQRVNQFWNENPEAREYEQDMNKLIKQEREENGDEAAFYLSRNLNRLYKLAKAERDNPDSLREAGRREEREELRRKQEGSAESGSASTQSRSSSTKVDRAWIEREYDPSNPEHRKLVDKFLAGK